MSEQLNTNYAGVPDETVVRDVLDTVTAACDNALHDYTLRENDGKLWTPLKADSLLMSTQTTVAPDLSDIFPLAPKAGEPVEVVSRYWYGALAESINVWLRTDPDDVSKTYCVTASYYPRVAPNSRPVLQEELSRAGYSHGERDEAPNEQSIPLLLERLYPGSKLDSRLALTDVFREAIWRQIEAGAAGDTREEYEKAIALDTPRGLLSGGFHLSVEQENRTHPQRKNRVMRIILRQAFGADEYEGGIYDGWLSRSVSIEQDPDGAITDVSQTAKLRLQNSPYIDGNTVEAYSADPLKKSEIPAALQRLTNIPVTPDVTTLHRFKRLATEPITQEDLHVF